jgi:hypothetical protein
MTIDPLTIPPDWQPFDEVYCAFAEANPMLGLNATPFAAARVRSEYGKRLIAAGAALRLRNRRWLARERLFAPALFAAMTQRHAEILARPGPAPQGDPGDATP